MAALTTKLFNTKILRYIIFIIILMHILDISILRKPLNCMHIVSRSKVCVRHCLASLSYSMSSKGDNHVVDRESTISSTAPVSSSGCTKRVREVSIPREQNAKLCFSIGWGE